MPEAPGDTPLALDLLRRLRRALGAAGLPELEAWDLLAAATGWPRKALYGRLTSPLPQEALDRAEALLKRRLQGYPLQYLVGEVEFFGLPLRVEEGVLIPRPETEGLVELALGLPLPPAPRILDVGTGTGAIALALKRALPEAEVYATEVDPKALALARENAERLGLAVVFLPAPLTGGLKDLDLVVSNPPYLPEAYREKAPRELGYESPLALYAGPEGLSVARPLAEEARRSLKPGGYLLLELAPENVHLLARELREKGWKEVAVLPDLAGRDRYLRARRPPEEAEGEEGRLHRPHLPQSLHPHPDHPGPPPEEEEALGQVRLRGEAGVLRGHALLQKALPDPFPHLQEDGPGPGLPRVEEGGAGENLPRGPQALFRVKAGPDEEDAVLVPRPLQDGKPRALGPAEKPHALEAQEEGPPPGRLFQRHGALLRAQAHLPQVEPLAQAGEAFCELALLPLQHPGLDEEALDPPLLLGELLAPPGQGLPEPGRLLLHNLPGAP